MWAGRRRVDPGERFANEQMHTQSSRVRIQNKSTPFSTYTSPPPLPGPAHRESRVQEDAEHESLVAAPS